MNRTIVPLERPVLVCSKGCGFVGGVSLTCLPVEVFERSGVRPLPASVEIQIIQTHPQSGAVTSEETCRNVTHMHSKKYIYIFSRKHVTYDFIHKHFFTKGKGIQLKLIAYKGPDNSIQ